LREKHPENIMKPLKMQFALLLLSALCLLTGAYGQVVLPNHVPLKVQNGSATPIGHYDPNQMLRLVLAVQPPHGAEEEQFIQELITKGSPNFHKFLSADEWRARFAPSAADEQKVVDWAQSQGLTVTKRYSHRLIVDVEAPAGVIEKAFGVTINSYQLGNQVRFSNDRDPGLPSSLSGIVYNVQGLDNIQVDHGSSPGSEKLTAPDYAPGPVVGAASTDRKDGDATKLPARAANGGTVSNLTGGFMDPTDLYSSQTYNYNGLQRFSHCCNVHNDSTGSPAVSSIAIAGFGNFLGSDISGFHDTYPYLAYNWTAYDIDGTPGCNTSSETPPCATGETTEDIEWSIATSNSFGSANDTSHVYIYLGGNFNLGTFTDIYSQILDDNTTRVMTTSWSCTEIYDCSTSTMDARHTIFNSMMDQGWTLIAASGDRGAADDCQNNVPAPPAPQLDPDAHTSVAFPASDFDFVAAGGTQLYLNSNGTWNSEHGWQGGFGVGSCNGNGGGSGGGVSVYYGQPSWQSSLSSLGANRLSPDLSLNALGIGQNLYINGGLNGDGNGTSVVAPELAGFFAQENTYLNYIGPICGSDGISVCTPVGLPTPFMYFDAIDGAPHNPFYDMTTGCNSNDATSHDHLNFFCAAAGYDQVTGWGSANMMQLAWGINWELIPAYGTPSVAFSGPATNTWYSTNQTVDWTVSDAGSSGFPAPGVAGFTQGWDSIPADPQSEAHGGTGNSFYSGPEYAFGTTGCLAFEPNGCSGGVSQGCHTVQVEGWDNQGRTTFGSSGPLCYDTVPPVAKASVTGTLVGSEYENLALVTLSATDSGYPTTGSGVANIYYLANELGVFEPYSSSFLLGKNGVNTVKYYAVDVAGNIGSTKTLTFGIINTTSISIASSANPSGAGKALKFTATVSAGLNTATGSVTFYDGGTVLATTALAGGVASFTTSKLASGTHLITASFLGSTYFVASESSGLVQYIEPGTTTVITSSANPSVFGQSVTLTATISHGTTIPTGTVEFKTGTTILATVTVGSSGTATYTSSAFTVATHSITAVYSGDSTYAGSTSPAFSQVVDKAATTTSLASSANPSVFGQSVTLTATVSAVAPATGTPAGTVQFYDGTTLLGSHALTSGVVAFATTKLATGTDSITAVYVASADYLASTSSALSQVVDKANTKVTLAASPNPSTSGATVTFTATVATVAPGAGTPTGTVTFMDGATELGTGTLNSSKKATFATASLAEGTHSITAVYSGDSNFSANTSAVLSQNVNP
jgi:hypothetical protein